MNELYSSLLELQRIDREIAQAETELQKIDPQIQEAEAPLRGLQVEIESLRSRLVDMRAQTSKLEVAATNKRDRLKQYEVRLERIRNAREEAAARTEMDLVRRAIDADEDEALDLLEQSRRTDLKADDLDKQLNKLRTEVEPKKQQLLDTRERAQQDLSDLRSQRTAHAGAVDQNALRIYERVRGTRGRAALAPLTADGACGNCFNIIPVQEQSQVRRAATLSRCEACGVILYPDSN
ncbi:MAG: zinc ribbon domain-containing protein [Longimicrobiales bacterium]